MRHKRDTNLPSQERIVFLGVLGSLVVATLLGGGEGVDQFFWAELGILFSVLVWLLGMMRRGLFILKRTSFDLPAALLFLFFLVSALLSPYRYNSTLGLYRYLSYLALFLLTVNLLSRPALARTVGFAIVFLSLGEAGLAIYQRHLLGIARATGTLSYSTYLMDYLSLGLSLSLGMALFDWTNRRERFLLLAGSAILLYAILLTGARAALFSLVAIFLTLGSLKGRRTLLAMLLLLLLVMAIPNPITERLFAGRKLDIYALERVNIWKQSLRVGLERPLSGVGFGNFEFFSRRFNFPVEEAVGRYAKIPEMAHNQYLELFAEVGILGLVALFYCLSLLFKSLPRLLPLTSGVEKGFLAGIVAFLVHSLFDNALYLPASSMLVSLCFGFLASKTSFGEVRRYLARRAVPVLLISVLGLACLSFLLRPVLSFRLYKKCKEYAQALDYRRAIERCEQASLLSPGCAVYYDALGKLYSARFGESQALSDLWLAYRRFQSALETNPVDSKLQEDFADFLVANAEHISSEEGDKALEVVRLLKRAVELDPYNPFIRGKLSSVYLELGRLEEARDELLEILELEPNFVRAYYQLGVVYGRMGDLEKSEIYLKRALSFKESNLKGRARSGYEEKLLEFDYRLVDKGQEN